MRSCCRFACVLGLAFTAGIGFATEEDAVKTLTAAGGKIQYDKVNKKKAVGGVSLNGVKVTDEVMKALTECPSLSKVVLQGNVKVTADGIKELSKLKKIQVVEMTGASVSDDGVKALATATTITELILANGTITDEGVKELATLTKLTSLALTQNKKLRGTTVPALVAMKNLKYLVVSDCELGDLAGWATLKGLSSLNTLALPQAKVSDAGLKELGKLTQLKSLSLEASPITDEGLAELKGLKALESLNLVGTKITEKAVPILSEMKKLDVLKINEKQIGKTGVEALKKALPNCDVNALP